MATPVEKINAIMDKIIVLIAVVLISIQCIKFNLNIVKITGSSAKIVVPW